MKEICLQPLPVKRCSCKSIAMGWVRGRAVRGVLRAARRQPWWSTKSPAPAQQRPLQPRRLRPCRSSSLQVRTMTGLRWWQPRQHSDRSCSTCWAICGSPKATQARTRPGPRYWPLPGAHLHLYGKARRQARAQMGHLNITAATLRRRAPRRCRLRTFWALRRSEPGCP